MQWIKPTHKSRSEIDHAGDLLISSMASEGDKNRALETLNNWRAIHSYPLHVFKVGLKRYAVQVDATALTAQRLKRISSIIAKLKRSYHGQPPSMKLSQMQDIAGCRAVLATVPQVRKLGKEYYLKGNLKHIRTGVKDYISSPKADGYRSIHIVYRFFSDKGKKIYKDLLVEIQLRSKLQHYWATAIETVDFFTRQAIKSNEGQPAWMDFFKLVSSAFAIVEGCPIVPGTPSNENELYSEIRKREAELNVIKIMSGWTNAMRIFDEFTGKKKKAQFFLLELDILGEKMNITAYTKRQEQKAIEDYAQAEKRSRDKKEYDVVLVGVDSIADLKKAYPNYFVDTKEFLENLRKIIRKAN